MLENWFNREMPGFMPAYAGRVRLLAYIAISAAGAACSMALTSWVA